jgi:phosphopantetheinyl transferase
MPYLPLCSELADTRIGAWKIEEDELYFLERVKLYEHEWQRLWEIRRPQKRLEWLSSRLCLKELIQLSNSRRVESLNTQTGKPYLSDASYHISYTHSGLYSAAIASPSAEVAIDIEYLGHKRNLRTRFLFMNAQELASFEAQPDFELFLLIWSAKETLYKLTGPGYSFKEHFTIAWEGGPVPENGKLNAYVKRENVFQTYEICFLYQGEFILTYSAERLRQPLLASGSGGWLSRPE